MFLLCYPRTALERRACSHLLVLSSHEWEHATAIISNQLELPGPGRLLLERHCGNSYYSLLTDEDTEA